jgi:hypothetical protein
MRTIVEENTVEMEAIKVREALIHKGLLSDF